MRFFIGFQFLAIASAFVNLNHLSFKHRSFLSAIPDNTIILRSIESNANKLINSKDQLKHDSIGTLIKNIENNNIEEIIISGNLNDVLSINKEYDVHHTLISPIIAEKLASKAIDYKTDVTFLPIPQTFNFISPLINIAFLALTFNLIRSVLPKNLPFGQQNQFMTTKKFNALNITTKLSDWAGSPEIFEECTEIVSFLKDKSNYQQVGAQIPKGILLEGPPGTGKTLLAKAIAGEAEANFISVTGSEFVELFVGMGAARVRQLFEDARKDSPTIIFIYEIDAIGKKRQSGPMPGNDEREQTLNQLLAEMDGFNSNQDILVMGATNRQDVLDDALLRPGRFDRIIKVPLPDGPSRKAILDTQSKAYSMDSTIDWDTMVSLTSGFSGAQLKNLINEAAVIVARKAGKFITNSDLFEAFEKSILGVLKKTETRDKATLERVAIHEIGHTIGVLAFPDVFDFDKVSIQSSYNGAGGFTIFRDKNDLIESGMYTKEILFNRLMVILGGKAAETIFYGNDGVSAGAFQDLKEANQLAKQMITDFGMGSSDLEVFSSLNSDNIISGNGAYSEYLISSIDKNCLAIINYAYKNITEVLEKNKDKIIELKNKLVDKKVLYNNDIELV